MTSEKIREVIEGYREYFVENNYKKIDYPHDKPVQSKKDALEHCHGMLDKMVGFLKEGRREKAFRWLGFIQGVTWSHGVYVLTDLKNHNRPDE